MIGGEGRGPPALETWCVGQGSGQDSGSLKRALLTPWWAAVSLHQLLLWAAVCPCQTSPRAGCASPSHVMSFTNLLIHLANIYWTPPKSQALGIHTWIEHTWPLPSFEAFCKSLGRLFAWVWILVKMQMLWSRPELCAVSSCELSRDFQLQADAECLQGSAPHSRPR